MRALVAVALLVGGPVIGASWYAFGTWSGDGTKETPSFTTTKREWRVRWTIKPTDPKFANMSTFSGIVMDAKDDSAVSTFSDSKDGESYVRAAVGRYYIRVAGVNATWTVIAEEDRE